MTISLRLDDQTAMKLEQVARRKGVSKSELVRRCLLEYLGREKKQATPWELGKDLFGRTGSVRGGLARTRKQTVRERIHAKRRGR